jgi:hypothetical protein
MKLIQTVALLAGLSIAAVPASLYAQPVSESGISIGGTLSVSPTGTFKASAGSVSNSVDLETAYGIGGLVEYRISRNVSVGLAPSVTLHVRGKDDTSSGTELDLPLRVAFGAPVAPKLRLYGFVSPGYTILYPPDSLDNTDFGNPSGFMIGLGGGMATQLAPSVFLTGEISYQFRFPSTTVQNVDISLDVNYLTFAAGIVAML